MKNYFYTTCLILLFAFSGCKKLVDIPSPQNLLTADKVFADSTSAEAAMVNCYSLFDQSIDPGYNVNMGTYVDELDNPNSASDLLEFYQSHVSAANGFNDVIWAQCYNEIYQCNAVIEQLQLSANLPKSLTASFTAEAKFLRAYVYFYLVNTYGHVPLILTTNVNVNRTATQTDSATVYQQVVGDLKDAQSGLSVNYRGDGKVRANKWAAAALLARVYLFQRDWADAEATADQVISSRTYALDSPGNVFLANSNEAILQFWTQYGYITNSSALIPSSGIPEYPVTASLLNAFEPGDLRKSAWINSTAITTDGISATYYYPYKYHNSPANITGAPEYLMCLRLAEQYLIRSEARAQQATNVPGAVADINVIRSRAGLAPLALSLNQSACLTAVNQEWRVEFFSEWGHRYLDLKRTGRLNTVMAAYRSTWLPTAVVLPIPLNEVTRDINLKQNPGY